MNNCVYNQIMKDAQNVIKSKEEALKKINGISFDPHDRKTKTNESAINTDGILRELDVQSKKISNVESQRKKRDLLLKEIEIKNKELCNAKEKKT